LLNSWSAVPRLLFTTIMPPRKAIPSEEEDSQGSESPPLKKQKTSAAVSEVRGPRKRIASSKQSVLGKLPSHTFAINSSLSFSDENTVNANEKKVQDLEKKLAKAKQDAKKAKQLCMLIPFLLFSLSNPFFPL
jgi:hypothetical protein